MPLPLRLTAAVVALIAVFGVAGAAGAAFGPDRDASGRPHASSHGGMDMDGRGSAQDVRGLSVAEGGLRLVSDAATPRAGEPAALRFRVVDADGTAVRDFAVTHTKRMHAIVVRHDLTGFAHVHPRQAADGSWHVRWTPPAGGSYRLYADFRRGGRDHTLATDIQVAGAARMRALPPPARTASTPDGYRVRVEPQDDHRLGFAITRAGREVHPQLYLGAGGHLVALRQADGAFLHVHPVGHGGDRHSEGVEFDTEFPTAGTYRLFLQFKDAGRVHTAAFTNEVR